MTGSGHAKAADDSRGTAVRVCRRNLRKQACECDSQRILHAVPHSLEPAGWPRRSLRLLIRFRRRQTCATLPCCRGTIGGIHAALPPEAALFASLIDLVQLPPPPPTFCERKAHLLRC